MITTDISIPEWHDHVTTQPSGWSPDDLRLRVSQEQELRAIIADYYRSQMIRDKHYYVLQVNQKPVLSKQGALNLCSLFKVHVTADQPCEQHHEDGHYSVRYRVVLVHSQTGEGVADGDGFCTTRESKYAYRWVKGTELPDVTDTATLLRRQTRNGPQYRVSTSDLADHFNTVLKMACKRAIVAAALCLPLVSELFTQDGDLVGHPLLTGQSQSTQAQQPAGSPGTPRVTTAQVKTLWSRIKQHDVDFNAFRSYLAGFNLHSTKALTSVQWEQCLREIATRQSAAFQPHNTTPDRTDLSPANQRAQLIEALGSLRDKVAEAKRDGELSATQAQLITDLAQWIPRVSRSCEHAETPDDQLNTYLVEVRQALAELQEIKET